MEKNFECTSVDLGGDAERFLGDFWARVEGNYMFLRGKLRVKIFLPGHVCPEVDSPGHIYYSDLHKSV